MFTGGGKPGSCGCKANWSKMFPSVCKADRCAPGRVGFRWLPRLLSFGFGFVEVLVLRGCLRSKGVRKIESAISKKRRKRTHLRDLGYIYILKNTAKLKVKACSPKQVSLIQCNILIAKDKQSNI